MFVTDQGNEVEPPAQFAVDGLRLWRAVEVGFQLPWFCATFQYSDAEGVHQRTMFTVSIEDLLPGDTDQAGWGALLDVQLVSPAWVNCEGGWRMNSLSEIRSGVAMPENREVLIFVLEDGRYFAESGICIEQVTKQRSLFRFKRPSPSGRLQ